MSRIKEVDMRGVGYRVFFSNRLPKGELANCDPPTDARPAIRLLAEAKKNPRQLLGLLLHEGLHACLWDLSEEAVLAVERSLTDLILAHLKVEVADDPLGGCRE